jgi:threonine dehydrogenase-like Zn-dependent dehydrogenase
MSLASGAALAVSIGAPAQRIQLARQWGAHHAINIEEVRDARERAEMVRKWTDGRGADLVIDAAGPAGAFEDALAMVRRGGRILVIGQSTQSTIPFSPRRINKDMLDIIGVVSAHVSHFYKAMQFLKVQGARFRFEDMLTNSYPLAKVTEALESMAALREIKPAILPELA